MPAASAGRELTVTVVDAIETGTVPLILAVTLPMCAVPAGRDEMMSTGKLSLVK